MTKQKQRLRIITRIGQKRFLDSVERRRNNKKSYKSESTNNSHLLIAPTEMSLSRNYEETVAFLDEFRSAVLPDEKRTDYVNVDLTKIKSISMPVAIILAAEFHRWSLVQNIPLRPRKVGKWNKKLLNLFSDLGVFELLNVPRRNARGVQNTVTLSPLESGLETEGQKIHSLQSRYQTLLENFATNLEVYAGLVEAIENAISHAYPDNYSPKHQNAGHRWWAASCLDFETNELRFFVFDQGAGIPNTLPRDGKWEEIWQAASKEDTVIGALNPIRDDGYILAKAFDISRSQTGLEERGKGLEKMRSVADAGENSRFRILSGKGEIKYQNGGNIEKLTHGYHIGGTLIEWSFASNVFETSGSN